MSTHDPRVDQYILEAAPFSQPLLTLFRTLVHRADAEIEEALKWSMPFFTYHGKNVCHMAAFKHHCGFGFWRREIQAEIAQQHQDVDDAMGSFGRVTKRADLPSDRVIINYVKQSCALIATGRAVPTRAARRRPELEIPAELASALRRDVRARKAFDGFAPSHRREYIEWITEAKRAETRATRIATTLGWLREGKTRNWKYRR